MSQSQFPPNWVTVKVKDVAKLSYGKALLANSRANSGNVLVYGSGGIVGKHDTSLSNGPSIIIGRKGNVGAIYLVDKPFWCIDTAFYLENISEMVDVAFLAHTLQEADLSQYTRSVAIPGIGREDIENVTIPLPPLPEQRRIAAILRGADEIRRLRLEANEKMQKIAEAVFYDMFGDPETNPRKWKPITLGDVTWAIQDGPHISPAYSDEGIPFLSTRNIRPGQVIWDDLKFISVEEANKHWKKCKPEKGDVLYTKGGTTGLAKAIDFDQEIAVWVHIALLKIKKDLVDPLWLESMLNSRYCYTQSQNFTHGATNHDLGLTRMVKIKFFLPPLDLQKQYVFQLLNLQNTAKQQTTAQERLNNLYQSILSRAFIGELTASWREQHAEELAQAARERDALLQGQVTFHFETATLEALTPPQRDERREDLIGQLSQLQQAIVDIFVSDMQVYFTANQFHDDYQEELQEKGFSISQDRTKRELRTLAALGLIREVTLPITDQPGRIAYATVYRYPQLEDETANEDLALLATRSVGV